MVDVKGMLSASASPASTAAGPCHNIIHEPTGLLNNTKDLATRCQRAATTRDCDNTNLRLFLYTTTSA